jgi:glycosyltransferase involved in cell wall biosynthesis
MKILFLHPNFPAQFRHLAAALAQNPVNQVVFGTNREQGELPGVQKLLYQVSREPAAETHRYVRSLEKAVLHGQGVYRALQPLQAQGFYPDVVYAHVGWGPGLFIKDIFPKTRYLGYFEWFYHAHGSDSDFDPADPLDADTEASIRIKNAPILQDLYACDRGLTPTLWQWQQFPLEFRTKLTILHDGIDTDYFQPQPGAKLVLPRLGLDLSQVDELVTYVARGMEPYRGFPQFMETVALLQQRRPRCHAVVVGEDRVAYGKPLPPGESYKDKMLQALDLDLSRLHFTGWLAYDEYLQVLQASSAHVYLTRPFVLSWSMLEAMAAGCLVVASSTQPVQEYIQHGENGWLVDFFSPAAIAQQVETVLNHPEAMQPLRQAARRTIQTRIDLKTQIQNHLHWLLEKP